MLAVPCWSPLADAVVTVCSSSSQFCHSRKPRPETFFLKASTSLLLSQLPFSCCDTTPWPQQLKEERGFFFWGGEGWSFRGWVCDHHGKDHGSRQTGRYGIAVAASLYLIYKEGQGGEREERMSGIPWDFETSNTIPAVHLPQGHIS